MNHFERSIRLLPTFVLGLVLASCSTPTELSHGAGETVAPPPPPPPPPMALSPEASIATMQLPKGYRLEPVLTEPQIAEPVMIAFDGNGRMYVAEMRSYMMDADGTGEQTLVSRISRHEDTDGDGVYDKHTVFADKLLLPRIMLTLDDRIIIGETNSDDLYIYRDSDGDGVADEKTLWFKGGPRGGNMEHQPNGLVWAMDNGLYSTYHDYRLRFGADGKAVKETIPVNGGQWGLTQDDWGKVWFVNAGNETGPVHFQQHIIYGQFSAPNELIGQYKVVWPIARMPDTQGGPGELRPNNTLNHFTATCGQDIFRGDRLPAELRGNLLFAEPVGRLIRRTLISVQDGVTHLANAYEDSQSEFIRATDPLFRPINMVTAPDGTLYIVDMYRGIIQQANWTQKGSYLRKQIEAHDLQKEIGRGRIYRLRHESFEPGPQPHMLDETPAEWVQHLSHPNGWWRDTAQKLLVLRRDLSVVPALEKLASQDSADPRPRLHALWTLDGLGSLNDKLILRALKAADPQVRMAGLRLADSRVNAKTAAGTPLAVAMRGALRDADPRVTIQAMLSVRRAGLPDAQKVIRATAEKSASVGVYAINEQLWDEANNEDPQLIRLLGVNGLKSYRAGSTLYKSVCFACHGTDGRGAPKPGAEGSTIAPPLAGSARVLGDERATIAIVLHGLQGAVDGVDYGAPMVPMNSYSDAELAGVLTYVRNSFGNRAPAVAPEAIVARRATDAGHANYWTLAELTEQLPALGMPRERFKRRAEWKLAANMAARDNSPLEAILDGDPKTGYFTEDVKPFPMEWLTVELPARSKIIAIDIDSRGEKGEDGKELGWAPFYSVEVSDDGKTWTMVAPHVVGEPHARLNLAAPVEARHLRIAITEKLGWQPWVIKELNLYGDESASMQAATPAGSDGPFVCTEVIGMMTTGEWYNAGFETTLGAEFGTQWQGRFAHYGYVTEYAKPGSYAWSATPVGGVNTVSLTAPCIQNANAPDRILYQAWSWELTSEEAWVQNLEAALTTIREKRPSAKRIELMTIVRCPLNEWCHPDKPPLGPDTNHTATQQDCHVPPYVDTAFAKVAANHPGLVTVAPKFEAHACAAKIDGIHLGDQNRAVAIDIGNHYKASHSAK